PLDQLLVITFGRAASQELRERVRDHLVEAERTATDPVHRQRLRDALASFDSATIATTHQFCQTVLRSLGVAGDTASGATLVESLDGPGVEGAADVSLRLFGSRPAEPPFGREAALSLARTVVGDAHAVLAGLVGGANPETEAGARVAF